jgi:hypothetical protein
MFNRGWTQMDADFAGERDRIFWEGLCIGFSAARKGQSNEAGPPLADPSFSIASQQETHFARNQISLGFLAQQPGNYVR